jgi:uncharacterized protein (TIGR03437 family)
MRRLLLPFAGVLIFSAALEAQISSAAYRALGQPDLHQNGLNIVQGVELNLPAAITVDARAGATHIYISDNGNSRILGWQDAASYQIGDPPAVVLAQPGPAYTNTMGIGPKGLNQPIGLAVDPATGNLYVADNRNNRVLRFASPFANPAVVEPDAVIGQPGFTTFGAGLSSSALNKPQALAFDSAGNLWVADTGNHRVLRFPSTVLDGRTSPQADVVVGQKDFTTGAANHAGSVSASGFDAPVGIAFDPQNNLYVADFNNARVVKFAAPVATNAAAVSVFGQSGLTIRGVRPASSSSMAGPAGIAVDSSGNLYVSVPSENRVLVFAAAAAATTVLGQPDFTSSQPNAASYPAASPNGLYGPADVKVDTSGNAYVVDAGNNRVLSYPRGSRTASQVWGQIDFTSNGPNQIKPGSIDSPFKIAIDYSQAPFALYVSDAGNHRILIWKDSVRYQTGDPADLVIGQPDLRTAVPNVDTGAASTPSATSLRSPKGIAVDSAGNLYVADSGNNRVLRYPRPISQTGRIRPDAVLGQPNFVSAVSAAVSASSLRAPAAVVIGPDGNLFVADSGNHRVLEFAASFGVAASAIRVYGQPNFNAAGAAGAVSLQTLNTPSGLFVDLTFNLYIADTGNNRIVVFPNTQSAPAAGLPAALVFGQGQVDSGSAGGGATGLRGPADVAVDDSGNIFVSDTGNNRVVVYPSVLFAQPSGTRAIAAVGQRDLNANAPNWDSSDGLATPDSLLAPVGIYLDRHNTLYVGDVGNNRVLQFLRAAAVVNAATFQAGVPVAQGSLAALFSSGICDQPQTAPGMPWPASLANRQIVVNDSLVAPLYVAVAGQINFQLPSASPVGVNRIAVRTSDTGELLAGMPLSIAPASPGLFTVSMNGTGQGVVVNQDGTLNSSSNPAARGSAITLYGTGQGRVSPPVPDGGPAPFGPLSGTVTVPASDAKSCLSSQQSMCVVLGNGIGPIQFSGLAPGWVGLWQINITVPSDASTGTAVPVKVVINGVPSNTITIAIR